MQFVPGGSRLQSRCKPALTQSRLGLAVYCPLSLLETASSWRVGFEKAPVAREQVSAAAKRDDAVLTDSQPKTITIHSFFSVRAERVVLAANRFAADNQIPVKQVNERPEMCPFCLSPVHCHWLMCCVQQYHRTHAKDMPSRHNVAGIALQSPRTHKPECSRI